MPKSIKNLSNIQDTSVALISQSLGLQHTYSVVVVVNSNMDKLGDIQFAFKEQICFITLKNSTDVSTLAHELRHLWQMEQLGAEIYEALYAEEMLHETYENNVFELDAFEWENQFMQLFHPHIRVA